MNPAWVSAWGFLVLMFWYGVRFIHPIVQVTVRRNTPLYMLYHIPMAPEA
jgi:hypothetical protein